MGGGTRRLVILGAVLVVLVIAAFWTTSVRAGDDTGIVQGTVTISPCRPVERRDDPPCPPIANATLQFQSLDEPDFIFEVTTDADGFYEIELPEGTYNVTLQRSINKTPQQVTVIAGETVTADLTFDIGIR